MDERRQSRGRLNKLSAFWGGWRNSIRDSLRSYWGNPWRCESSSAHSSSPCYFRARLRRNVEYRQITILVIYAGVAQLVERNLAKVNVAGSNPVSRSKILNQKKNFERRNIMQIMEFLSKKAILTDIKSGKKEDVVKELVDALVEAGEIEKRHRNKLFEALMARESLGSTAIGQGIAIPHAKSDCVDKLVAAFGISKKGVDFDSLDGELAYIFFLLVAPQDSAGPHLKALARISRLLKDKYFRDTLRSCADEKAVVKIISEEDEKKI